MQRSVQRVRRARGELLHGVQVRHGRPRSTHWQLPPERSHVADVRGPDSSTHSSADACAGVGVVHVNVQVSGPWCESHLQQSPGPDAEAGSVEHV